VDPDQDCESGSRQAKIAKKGGNEERKTIKFMSWSLDSAQCLDQELDSVNPDWKQGRY